MVRSCFATSTQSRHSRQCWYHGLEAPASFCHFSGQRHPPYHYTTRSTVQDRNHISLFQPLPERGEGRRRSLLAAWKEERQISPPLSRKSAYQPLIHVYSDSEGRLISCFLGLRLPFPSSQSYRDTNRGAIIAQNSLPFSLDRKFNL